MRGRACAVVLVTAVVSLLAPTAVAVAEEVPAPESLCTVRDSRLAELSGLAADGDRWYAMGDGGTKLQVVVLGRDCGVQKVISAAVDPYDVEDLARAKDGTLWLADTGDNRKQRETVALHALTPAGKATLYRLTYPDGQHDAEALLLDGSGTPFVVTKNVLGKAEVYKPAAELKSPGPNALEKVGTLDIATTDTPGGPVGGVGSMLVTGGAVSQDGKTVALRTYTDAYLYAAPDGDVAAALKRNPVRVPLPNEPQGEAIAFEPDGTLLSASEGTGQPVRAVRGAAALAAATTSADERQGSPGPTGDPATGGSESGVPLLPAAAIAVLVALGLVFVVSRVWRARRG
ncbi:hypothetical protein [Amycolatopsis sp. YIM 10]|uniref:hypothetical protein n=1 Tax=Amycolatopsis sp. YIM 10 TaxID=2653857 RepID=UPI0012A94181|nr:hypothetical protein [Amycolatopsis sp. YIM 10]QFU87907.1 hypothetical protein YIM_13605 [Amycolatopsis sp. YIM 10]